MSKGPAFAAVVVVLTSDIKSTAPVFALYDPSAHDASCVAPKSACSGVDDVAATLPTAAAAQSLLPSAFQYPAGQSA
jgi:hypothetical protein